VGKQKFNGLSQQLAGEPAPTTGMGGNRTPPNAFMASWKKTTAAATAATAAATSKLTSKADVPSPEDDPLRLDRMPKKIGADVYVGAARLMENQGKFAEAEDKYREALRASPNDLNAMVGLGRLYDRQGQAQKAIEVYQKASQAHPTNGLVFNDLGLCYRRQRQMDKSMVAFRKAVDLVPDNVKYRNNLAAALVDAGRINEAYQELAAANSAAVAHYNLAFMLQQKGQRADCLRHLQEAVTLDPALTPAREMLAQLGGNSTAPTALEQPAPRPASAPRDAPIASYATGASDQRLHAPLYTSAPQVEAAPAIEPPSYHIGDDVGPAAEVAQRTAIETSQRPTWGSAAWAIPSTAPPATQPLPPIE
jgi:tetratricopeptide (TPR) repeat protein